MQLIKYIILISILFLFINCTSILNTTIKPSKELNIKTETKLSYNEKTNTNTIYFYIPINNNPMIIFQIFNEENKTNSINKFGLFLEVANTQDIKLRKYTQIILYIDGERFDFYGYPTVTQDVFKKQALEYTYFYSNKPNIGNIVQIQQIGGASLQSQQMEITDINPKETDKTILKLIEEISKATKVEIKLFSDESINTIQYIFSGSDKEVFKQFAFNFV